MIGEVKDNQCLVPLSICFFLLKFTFIWSSRMRKPSLSSHGSVISHIWIVIEHFSEGWTEWLLTPLSSPSRESPYVCLEWARNRDWNPELTCQCLPWGECVHRPSVHRLLHTSAPWVTVVFLPNFQHCLLPPFLNNCTQPFPKFVFAAT